MTAPLVLSMGDPAGCGPQITSLAWHELRSDPALAFYVIAPPAVFDGLCPVAPITAPAEAAAAFSDALPVLGLKTSVPMPTAGKPDPSTAPAILASIEQAVSDAQAGNAAAIVTNPINKALLYSAGFTHPGHTEYIAALCAPGGAPPLRPVMMLTGGGLRVALATIHMPLMETAAAITRESLTEIAKIVGRALKQDFGLAAPRIAFSGLNPHAGEDGTIGTEERDTINPAARALRDTGLSITNARPGDTVFAEALAGQYDAVIAMTHDQGLIPIKTLDLWGGVNTTLGLPIIRTSPDHGTAYDAAASGSLRADSLIAAIRLARTMVDNRTRADD